MLLLFLVQRENLYESKKKEKMQKPSGANQMLNNERGKQQKQINKRVEETKRTSER